MPAGERARPRDAAVVVRPPARGEEQRLREIALAANAHWGYDAERVQEWAASDDLAFDTGSGRELHVADAAGAAVGWASLVPRGEAAWLDDLWVDPPWMGRGVGALLFRHAAARARSLSASRLEWEAEPNAVGFYARMGGRYLRDGEPGAWGRSLPVMGVDLAGTAPAR